MNHPSNRTPSPKLLGLPRSGLGWSSIWLALAFFVIIWLFRLYASTSTRYRPTFFSDPLNALLLITASLAGISSGVTALLALISNANVLCCWCLWSSSAYWWPYSLWANWWGSITNAMAYDAKSKYWREMLIAFP